MRNVLLCLRVCLKKRCLDCGLCSAPFETWAQKAITYCSFCRAAIRGAHARLGREGGREEGKEKGRVCFKCKDSRGSVWKRLIVKMRNIIFALAQILIDHLKGGSMARWRLSLISLVVGQQKKSPNDLRAAGHQPSRGEASKQPTPHLPDRLRLARLLLHPRPLLPPAAPPSHETADRCLAAQQCSLAVSGGEGDLCFRSSAARRLLSAKSPQHPRRPPCLLEGGSHQRRCTRPAWGGRAQ